MQLQKEKQKKKKDIFIRKHSSCNSPDHGSIFLIEERENKEVYMNEDQFTGRGPK